MEKMNGESLNIVADNIVKLKQILPEVFNEDKVDFEKLEQVLGEYKDTDNERYSFTWPGKAQAIRISQTPSTGTLRPCKGGSVNWDETENLYIEGDNLEVLKLLQKSYYGKVKVIYIDPPYNTGKDFVYPDNFRDNVKNYLEITKQIDRDGNRVRSNSETEGRYHTKWLNMMYPRLRLAKNLLKDDGVIFMSIDDKEAHNLKKISDEIFGENNFVGTITWEKRTKAQNTIDAKDMFQSKTEYILIYKKSISKIRFNLEVSGTKEYPEKDEKGEFRYKVVEEMSALGMRGRESMIYPILGIYPGADKQWKYGTETTQEFSDRGDLILREGKPYYKVRPKDEDAAKYYPFWSHFFDKEAYGTAETGKTELSEVLGTKAHNFETVKPVKLIKKLIYHVKDMDNQEGDSEDIILDFFSGSATTAHAVMELSLEDNRKRKYIMVQLPECIEEESLAYKEGFKNICEIGKRRIDLAGRKLLEQKYEKKDQFLDTGFKLFKLDTSNIKSWDSSQSENIEEQLFNMVNNIKEDRSEEDILFEILLKYGVDLNAPIEEQMLADKKVYAIGFGAIIACLADNITLEVIEAIGKLKEELDPGVCRVVFKDKGFDSDAVKTNAVQILKRYDIHEVKSI